MNYCCILCPIIGILFIHRKSSFNIILDIVIHNIVTNAIVTSLEAISE